MLSTVQYSTVQYSTVQYSTAQSSTVHSEHNTVHHPAKYTLHFLHIISHMHMFLLWLSHTFEALTTTAAALEP